MNVPMVNNSHKLVNANHANGACTERRVRKKPASPVLLDSQPRKMARRLATNVSYVKQLIELD